MNSDIFSNVFLLSALGAAAYSLRSIPEYFWGRIKNHLFYTAKVYEYDDLFSIMEEWLQKNYISEYREVEAFTKDRRGQGDNKPSDSESDDTVKIMYRQEHSAFTVHFAGKRLLISKTKEKIDKAQNTRDLFFEYYAISGIRAQKQVEELLGFCLEQHLKNRDAKRISIFTNNSYGDYNRYSEVVTKELSSIILPGNKKKEIIQDIQEFLENEDWYKQRGIPYKRGYLLHGPPGTGKTTLSLSISSHFQRDIYMLDLNSLESDSHLRNAFREISACSILLVEDIDKAFDGRKSRGKISFSTLLNCLDGALYKHGNIIIITTNHPEQLDPALTRAGRVDFQMEVGYPATEQIREYIQVFYGRDYGDDREFTWGIPMSMVQEICIRHKDDPYGALRDLELWKPITLNIPETERVEG